MKNLRDMSPSSLRLLGLDRNWKPLEGERKALLGSEQRMMAYDAIDTNTIPRQPNIEKKKGIVAEVLEKHLIPDDILKGKKTVYIGSATDVAYPLALGARNIILVDPCFSQNEWRNALGDRIKALVGEGVTEEEDVFTFEFNFGQGDETVRIQVTAQEYIPEEFRKTQASSFELPEDTGVVMLFATQGGASGAVVVTESLLSKVDSHGAVIQDADLFLQDTSGDWQRTQLGK